MKIQRDDVVRAALKILGEVGVDGVTTRRVAQELGVQSPALYWHFESKRALLSAMMEAILTEFYVWHEPEPGIDWREWMVSDAYDFRDALLAYRDGARLYVATRPDASLLSHLDAQVRFLVTNTFTPDDASSALLSVKRYVVGSVSEEQAELYDAHDPGAVLDIATTSQHRPVLARMADSSRRSDPDADFDYGLMSLIAGFSVKLVQQARLGARARTPEQDRS